MKHLKQFVLTAIVVFNGFAFSRAAGNERPLVLVVPSYNNTEYYQKNLDSIFSQEYDNYRVIYIDDASPDNTADFVEAYVEKCGQGFRFELVRNKTNMKSLHNNYHAIHSCSDDEIIVTLDGDDWLAHPQVLAKANRFYDDENVWMTHGTFEVFPSGVLSTCPPYPPEVILNNTFRKTPYRGWWHLRTFYASLFKKVKKADLMMDGKFFPCAGDSAFMNAMLEMSAGRNLIVDEVLYIYNKETGSSIMKTKQKIHNKVMRRIATTRPYKPLAPPFIRNES